MRRPRDSDHGVSSRLASPSKMTMRMIPFVSAFFATACAPHSSPELMTHDQKVQAAAEIVGQLRPGEYCATVPSLSQALRNPRCCTIHRASQVGALTYYPRDETGTIVEIEYECQDTRGRTHHASKVVNLQTREVWPIYVDPQHGVAPHD